MAKGCLLALATKHQFALIFSTMVKIFSEELPLSHSQTLGGAIVQYDLHFFTQKHVLS